MKRLKIWHIVLIIVVVLGGGGGGGYYYSHKASSKSDAAAATTKEYTVNYGNISNTVSASGSLTFPDYKNLTFGTPSTVTSSSNVSSSVSRTVTSTVSGKVSETDVNEGDSVKSGQVLAKLDLTSTITSLHQAVTQAKINLQNAQANLNTAQNPDTQANVLQAQLTIYNDQVALQNAQDDLANYQDNFSQAAIDQAQLTVFNAQTALNNANQDLSNIKNTLVSSYTSQVNQAQLSVDSARVALQTAQDDLTNAQTPYSQAQIEQAKTLIANDQIALKTTQDDLANYQDSFSQAAINQAQLAVINAETVLHNAQKDLDNYKNAISAVTPDVLDTLQQKQLAVTIAQDNLDTANDNLAKLNAGPDPLVVQQKQQAIATASANLVAAQDDLAKMTADTLIIQQKQQAVIVAQDNLATGQNNLATAQANLSRVTSGDTPVEIQQKQYAITIAQDNLAIAIKNLSKVTAGPDSAMTQQKQAQVDLAQENLAEAQQNLVTVKNNNALQVELYKTQVAAAQTVLDNATDNLNADTITAPFDGIITAVNVAVGDTVDNNTAAIQIVDPTKVDVSATLAEVDVTNVKMGQQATITLDAYSDMEFTGKVTSLSPIGANQSGVVSYPVTISMDIPSNVKLLEGMSATANIIYEQATHVLLIPTNAVHGNFISRTVSVLVNGKTDEKSVKLGITDGQYYEVTSGLQEGDILIVPSKTTGTVTTNGNNQGFPGGGGLPGGFPGGFGGAPPGM